MAEPVTYPGGTQWAIKRNDFLNRYRDHPYYVCKTTDLRLALEFYEKALRRMKTFHPDNPELWPELVSAHITWQVVE